RGVVADVELALQSVHDAARGGRDATVVEIDHRAIDSECLADLEPEVLVASDFVWAAGCGGHVLEGGGSPATLTRCQDDATNGDGGGGDGDGSEEFAAIDHGFVPHANCDIRGAPTRLSNAGRGPECR